MKTPLVRPAFLALIGLILLPLAVAHALSPLAGGGRTPGGLGWSHGDGCGGFFGRLSGRAAHRRGGANDQVGVDSLKTPHLKANRSHTHLKEIQP